MIRTNLLIWIILTGTITLVSAQTSSEYFTIKLWKNGYPNTNGTDHRPSDEQKKIYEPEIRIYLSDPAHATGRAVIVCPGGGYGHLAYNHEGYDFAPFFNDQGIALIVLKYRMPFGHKEVPFSDVEEAMRVVKDNASEWDINPYDIGIMGASAGGHLASTFATRSKPDLRPAFQILLYPVISMEEHLTHKGSRKNLLGENPTSQLIEQYSNEKHVTQETPPAFIIFSGDDKAVLPANGINYYLALNKLGIPAALHIYPSGGHGWGYKDSFKYKKEFLSELKSWLSSF